MYENYTFEYILNRALALVSDDVDKRPGSIIWDSLAPAAAEMAQMYIEFDNILKLTYAGSSFGEWLDKRCGEMGVYRRAAEKALRLGLFYTGAANNRQPFNVPIGSRYNIEALNYVVTEKIDEGIFALECETPGIIGNQLFGRLSPIETVKNLSYGELGEVLIPGENVENDLEFYRRYEEKVNSSPFGGNIDDYKQKIKAIEGVGGCKIFPAWQGGGTVKATAINSLYLAPSPALLEKIQEIIDPVPFHQLGMGKAPIGHWVTVQGASPAEINLKTRLYLKPGFLPGQFQEAVEEVFKQYLHELASRWEDEDNIIVRVNQLEARILNIDGVIDIEGTALNGVTGNITLGAEEIPVMGSVVLDG